MDGAATPGSILPSVVPVSSSVVPPSSGGRDGAAPPVATGAAGHGRGAAGQAQSDLLRKEVFLVETIHNASSSRESMAHLKAIYFLRPSADNVQKLCRHLAMPRFTEYHLFFSNILKIPQIQILADSDEQEVFQQVQHGSPGWIATQNMEAASDRLLPSSESDNAGATACSESTVVSAWLPARCRNRGRYDA